MKLLAFNVVIMFFLQTCLAMQNDNSNLIEQNTSYCTTDRCIVRSAQLYKDFNALRTLFKTPEVAKFAFGPELNATEIQQLDSFKNKIALVLNMTFKTICPSLWGYLWVIENSENQELIGVVSAELTNAFPGMQQGKYIQVGCQLHPTYHGKGYAKEAGEKLLTLLEKDQRFASGDMLVCRINAANEPSIKFAKEMGFKPVQELTISEPPYGIGKGPFQAYIYARPKNKSS